MATCKDCIHEEICDMPIITDGRKNASNCKHFKNKADFVEVVRCSECAHANNHPLRCICHRFHTDVNENGFCSYGEKR